MLHKPARAPYFSLVWLLQLTEQRSLIWQMNQACNNKLVSSEGQYINHGYPAEQQEYNKRECKHEEK